MILTTKDWQVKYFNGRNVRDKYFATEQLALDFVKPLQEGTYELWHKRT